MMKSKWLKVMVWLSLFLMLAAPMGAMAQESVTAAISFTVENTPGTVIMEALNGAPAPVKARFDDVAQGTFEITLTEPGDYFYTVYQQAGTLPNTYYDTLVYKVGIYVFVDDSGSLIYSTVISTEDNSSKPEGIVFTNTPKPDAPTTIRVTKKAYRGSQQVTEVFAGDEITYEIAVFNTGSATAYDVKVTDKLPVETPLLTVNEISDEGVLSPDGKTITWEIPRILAGESAAVRFTVIIPLATDSITWRNTATAVFREPIDSEAPWPVAEAKMTEYAPHAVLRKEQSHNDGERTTQRIVVEPGDRITYFITATNDGETAVQNVIVSDEIPPTLILDADSISNDGSEEDGVITWMLDDLEKGESATVSFTCVVPVVTERTSWINRASGSYTNASSKKTRAMVIANGSYRITLDLESVEVEAVYEPGEDPTPDTTPDVTPDTTPDVSPDTTPDVSPDTTPDVSPDTTPDVSPDVTPDTTPDVSPEGTTDVPPDTTPDTMPDVPPDVTPDVSPDTTPDATTDVPPDTTPDVSPDTTPDVTPDVSPDVTPDVSPDTTPDVPPEATTETPPEATATPTAGLPSEPTPTGTAIPGVTASPAPGATATPGNATSTQKPSTPKTGDDSQMLLWLAVMAISFLGIAIVLILLHRKGRKEE